MTRIWLLALGAMAIAALAACGTDESDDTRSPSGTITVSAASSLTDAFQEIGDKFHARFPGASARFNFGSSAALARQIREGAPSDIFAPADPGEIDALRASGLVDGPAVVFAANQLAVVAPAKSQRVRTFQDLGMPGVRLVVAARSVPAGSYARTLFHNAAALYGDQFETDALANIRSEDPNVRAVLARVQLGEADAGVVYSTDIVAGGRDVRVVEIPASINVRSRYAAVVIADQGHRAAASAFVTLLSSAEAQEVFTRRGFLPAEAQP